MNISPSTPLPILCLHQAVQDVNLLPNLFPAPSDSEARQALFLLGMEWYNASAV